MSLDEQLAPIIEKLEDSNPIGKCDAHPKMRCFEYHTNSWHFELSRHRLQAWANQIVSKLITFQSTVAHEGIRKLRKNTDYSKPLIGGNFFHAKDRIPDSEVTVANPLPQTPGPWAAGGVLPPGYHPAMAHSPWSVHGYPTMAGNFIAPPTPQQFYPYPVTPPGYPPMPPWGYSHMPQLDPQIPHTPLAGHHRNINIPGGYPGPQTHNIPQLDPHAVSATPGPPGHHNITGATSNTLAAAAQPSGLENWCSKHNLGNEERQGLMKLGFWVGDGNLVALPASEWEWAGLGPLHKQRILAAYNAED